MYFCHLNEKAVRLRNALSDNLPFGVKPPKVFEYEDKSYMEVGKVKRKNFIYVQRNLFLAVTDGNHSRKD